MDEAHKMALKAELMEKRPIVFPIIRETWVSHLYNCEQRPIFTGEGQNQPKNIANQTQRNTVAGNNHIGARPTTTAAKEAPQAPNPYTKTGGLKCYMRF